MFVQQNTLRATKDYFSKKLKEHFSDSEIRYMFQVLAEERMGWSRTEMVLNGEARLSESDLLYFRTAAHKLLEGVPFQHIVGFSYFYDLKIKTDRRALVPRPETEELVEWVLKEQQDKAVKIVDICTGTGCIALALKKQHDQARISAWDISVEALQLAKENATNLNLTVQFEKIDILSTSPNDEKWDVIVSNPPYIPMTEKGNMSKTVTDFDPDLALFVPDEDPLLFYRAIGLYAQKNLANEGVGYFEIHEDLGKETENLLQEMGFRTVLRKDMQGKDRMIKFTFSGIQ